MHACAYTAASSGGSITSGDTATARTCRCATAQSIGRIQVSFNLCPMRSVGDGSPPPVGPGQNPGRDLGDKVIQKLKQNGTYKF